VLSGDAVVGRLLVLHDVTAERAIERMREDMISMMVHDLRNPVGAAYTAVELLRSGELGELDPDQHEAVAIVNRSLNRVQTLINNILSLRELESGQVPIEYTEIHLSALVDETLRVQTSLAAARQVRLENQVLSDLPAAWADADLIGRVLQNLVDNAIKFSPAGGWVRVTAKTVREGDRTAIWVSVCDSGPGIPSSIRGQLFQKFVTGRQKGRGSGLGLAFCKLALEAHGERIWTESVPECGTTFTFSLPVFEGAGRS
jgi:signal transduction histidine kinase